MSTGRYWMRLSRFFLMAASWGGVLQEPRSPRLFLHVRPGALDRVELRGIGTGPRSATHRALPMALDHSALLEALDALKAAEVDDRIRQRSSVET